MRNSGNSAALGLKVKNELSNTCTLHSIPTTQQVYYNDALCAHYTTSLKLFVYFYAYL